MPFRDVKPFTLCRVALLALGLIALLTGPLYGQVLPPIYKPLPLEAGSRLRAAADSLRARAAETQLRAAALEEGARTLRQNGAGVAGQLLEEASRLAARAERLESRATVDSSTAAALDAQAEEFARKAQQREQRAERLRGEVAQLRIVPVDSAGGEAAAPAAERLAQLQAEVRADSQTAVEFSAQARELRERAQALRQGADAARARGTELRQQEQRLRAYAAEIASGRSRGEPTAVRLVHEAAELQRSAEQLARRAQDQAALADELRVQAGRAWLPVRSRTDAMRFYGEEGRAVLRSLVVALRDGGGAGSVHSEMVSDYAGPVRFGVGVVLADGGTATDSTAKLTAARERFFAGGGNLVTYATLPVLFHRSGYHSLTLQLQNKLGVDTPGARGRAEAGSLPVNLDLGVEAYGTFNTFHERIRAFGLLRSAVARGNAAFHAHLGRPDAGALRYVQATLGVEIASVAKVLLSGARGADGLERPWTVTFQLAPAR